MKQTSFFLLIFLLAPFLYGADSKTVPSPQVSTPADKPISSKNLTLGEKESTEWKKMRMERQKAREQILSKIRESSGKEKEQLRRQLSKNRNHNARFNGGFPKTMKSRERTPLIERPESHEVRPERDNRYPPWPPLPPCPWGDCNEH